MEHNKLLRQFQKELRMIRLEMRDQNYPLWFQVHLDDRKESKQFYGVRVDSKEVVQ